MPTPTVDSIVGKLLRRCPIADYFLALDWVEEAFRAVWERREWSWRRKEGHLRFNAAYSTGTADITRGTDQVTIATGVPTVDMIGRQWRAGVNYPIYTITDVIGQVLTIDRLWSMPDLVAGTYEIYNAFVELAADFDTLIDGVDPSNAGTPLSTITTQGELNARDGQRSSSGSPVDALVLRDYAGSGGAARYEVWPHQKSDAVVVYNYFVRMPDLSDAGATIPPLLTEDVLLQLALKECAGWPGYEGRPNPYYRLGLIDVYDRRAERQLVVLEVADQNRVVTDVVYDNSTTGAIYDDGYHQNHDIGWD